MAIGKRGMPMLTYHRTSLLESQAQTLVNTVNTVGIMGKGLAADFKKRYPQMFEEYKHAPVLYMFLFDARRILTAPHVMFSDGNTRV
jgi:hypothetical protein